jgi:hypothetical protein
MAEARRTGTGCPATAAGPSPTGPQPGPRHAGARTVTGTGPTGLRALIEGPSVRAEATQVRAGLFVVRAGGRLVVLTEPTPGDADRILPCTVIVPVLAQADPPVPGRPALVGDATIRLGDLVVRVVRWRVPATVRPASAVGLAPLTARPALTEPPPGTGLRVRAAARLAAATDHLLAGRPGPAAELLISVLGEGPGSTPAADDAVGGILLAARGGLPDGRTVRRAAAMVAEAAVGRTTSLSAELLRQAADGFATAAAVRAVGSADPGDQTALLSLGATSGAATAWGIDLVRALADEHLTGRPATPGRAATGAAA